MESMETSVATTGQWKHDLFSCFANGGICIVTYLLPCYTAGKVAQAVGLSCPLYGLCHMVPILGFVLDVNVRLQVRDRHGIQGTVGSDMLIVFCCTCCALIQEANETSSALLPQNISRH